MASMDDLYTALRNADAAGDNDGAAKLAAYIKTQIAAPTAPPPAAPPAPSPLAAVPSGPATVPGSANATSPQAEDIMNAHPELRPGVKPTTPIGDTAKGIALGVGRFVPNAVGGAVDIAKGLPATLGGGVADDSDTGATLNKALGMGPTGNPGVEDAASAGNAMTTLATMGVGMPGAMGAATIDDTGAALTGAGAKIPAVEKARSFGLKVLPSDVANSNEAIRGSVPGTTKQSFMPSSVQDIRSNNVPLSTDLAAQDVGLAPGITKLTDAHRELAEAPLSKAYDDVGSSLGSNMTLSPTTKSALEDFVGETDPKSIAPGKAVKQAQSILDSSSAGTMSGSDLMDNISYFKKLAKSNKTDAQSGIQDVGSKLQDEVGSQLDLQNDPAGAAKYKAARAGFGKVNDLWDNLKAGQVDVPGLTALDDKTGGKVLTGNLKMLADFGREAPESSKFNTGTGDVSSLPGSKLGLMAKATDAIAHGAAKLAPGLDPTSDAVQNQFGAGPATESPVAMGEAGAKSGPVSIPDYLAAVRAKSGPAQGNLPMPQPLDMAPPPGSAGPLPSTQPTGSPGLGLGEALQMEHPPGPVPPAKTMAPIAQGGSNMQTPYQLGLNPTHQLQLTPPPGNAGNGLGNALMGSVDDVAAAGSAHGKAAATGGKPEEKGLPTDMADRKRETQGMPPAGQADHAGLAPNAIKEIIDNIQKAPLTLKDLKTGDGAPPSPMEQFLMAMRKSQGK